MKLENYLFNKNTKKKKRNKKTYFIKLNIFKNFFNNIYEIIKNSKLISILKKINL